MAEADRFANQTLLHILFNYSISRMCVCRRLGIDRFERSFCGRQTHSAFRVGENTVSVTVVGRVGSSEWRLKCTSFYARSTFEIGFLVGAAVSIKDGT